MWKLYLLYFTCGTINIAAEIIIIAIVNIRHKNDCPISFITQQMRKMRTQFDIISMVNLENFIFSSNDISVRHMTSDSIAIPFIYNRLSTEHSVQHLCYESHQLLKRYYIIILYVTA